MKLEEYLAQLCEDYGFAWISITNHEGLALSQYGIDEPFELAALLPDWVSNGDQIASAAKMDSGMGLICLVPKRGAHALLLRSFISGDSEYILFIATRKMPPKAVSTLSEICNKLCDYL